LPETVKGPEDISRVAEVTDASKGTLMPLDVSLAGPAANSTSPVAEPSDRVETVSALREGITLTIKRNAIIRHKGTLKLRFFIHSSPSDI